MFRKKKYNKQGTTIDKITVETAISLIEIPPQTPERKKTKKTENGIDTAFSKSVVFIKPSLNIRFRNTMFLRTRIVLESKNIRMVVNWIQVIFMIIMKRNYYYIVIYGPKLERIVFIHHNPSRPPYYGFYIINVI